MSAFNKEETAMCPFCIANIALLAAATASTGGLTAFAAKKLHASSRAREISSRFTSRIKSRLRSQDPHHHPTANLKDKQHFSNVENC